MRLTELALHHGFRGIDTANQRRHYHEAAVGEAITAAVAANIVSRSELFLQTKFTFRRGQDHRLPYDADAPVARQVEQSFASSLQHLGAETIDSYLLHGPSSSAGLTPEDWEAWQAMEEIQQSGRAKLLGVSNFSREQLQLLCDRTRVPVSFVQNRCYALTGWDRGVREFCRERAITYQGFSLLTANRQALADPKFLAIARRHDRSVPAIIFQFAMQAGMIALTGTKDGQHMREDLAIFDFQLDPEELEQIERGAEEEY